MHHIPWQSLYYVLKRPLALLRAGTGTCMEHQPTKKRSTSFFPFQGSDLLSLAHSLCQRHVLVPGHSSAEVWAQGSSRCSHFCHQPHQSALGLLPGSVAPRRAVSSSAGRGRAAGFCCILRPAVPSQRRTTRLQSPTPRNPPAARSCAPRQDELPGWR